MKIIVSFPRDLILAAIQGLGRYHETVESQLRSASYEEKSEIQKRIKSMGWSREEEIEEWDLAIQSHDMTFNMLLPNFFRYSLLVLLFLVVENKLGELSRVAAHKHPASPSPPHPRQNIIGSYERYFTDKISLSSLNWGIIHELNSVRNCIVHASGKVKGRKDEEQLREIAMKHQGIAVSGPKYLYPTYLRPLYLEDDMLMIEAPYCSRLIDGVYQFFKQLCDELGLGKLKVEDDS